VTIIPLRFIWGKEDRTKAIKAKKKFFLLEEKPVEYKNGVRRESLPYT